MPQCAKVLFVDDDQAVLDALRRGLCRCYDMATARGPLEGLRLLTETGPFAVVVSDLRMPGMDGVAFLQRAKELCPTAVTVMLTGHGDLTAAMAAVNEGHIFRFLTKPCPVPVLSRALDAALAQYRMAASEKELLRVTLENAQLKEDVERIMRHDLKSPLTTIISLPQVLGLAENLDDDQRDMLALIEDAGYMILSMVNLSTALFKMERGQYALAPVAVDLVRLVRKILGVHADTARSRGLALETAVHGAPAEAGAAFSVRGEELLCYSMLANLIDNAVTAAPDGTPVRIDLCREGETARIAIHNQGAVPLSVRERFFEKYATAGKPKGTGLGTYSARLIARAHGGDVVMETGDAAGTLVTVSLPAA
ncbi:response regulator receiver sensor signal transduction histidine kinase [Solidesulfovibrio carbinoliphilus subsp. oakridgensis]|uniref:histidine kinase n=1 Tax=Solidesulfovibrio carbinoliphilus subsp. oakridgensis TaxID=694327 RepID=G7QAV5_9BACT|nr:hybrid sensor histidine kinase/response regulator [Solidesulfovibrio carbinoliphilus]EHJ48296.1 response regulator receiver sensor signal transduction histidine kinase [Solidesulfovibrio carbinoliphilus subsp. oakridgensis]